jgi:hypothetical protein
MLPKLSYKMKSSLYIVSSRLPRISSTRPWKQISDKMSHSTRPITRLPRGGSSQELHSAYGEFQFPQREPKRLLLPVREVCAIDGFFSASEVFGIASILRYVNVFCRAKSQRLAASFQPSQVSRIVLFCAAQH